MFQDLRLGLRILRRNPTFSVAAIFIVGLGIAATCIVFSFAEAAVFRVLPFRNPSRFVRVSMTDVEAPYDGGVVSAPVLLNWREQGKKVGQFAVRHSESETMVGAGEPEQIFVETVSEGMFRMLGVRPILGRTFAPSDYKPGSPPAVVLSYWLWQSRFNGKRDVLSRSIRLDGVSYNVVGVMPSDFLMPGSGMSTASWTPLIFTAKEVSDIDDRAWEAWGKLNSGVSVQQAQAALSVLTKQVMNQPGPKQAPECRIDVTPVMHYAVKQWRSALMMLLGAVAFLLAIACVNVANLLLARAYSRHREIAVRLAVGANRRRVIRQLLTESAVLGAFGGLFGILLAHWGIGLEIRLLPESLRFQTADFRQMGIDSTLLIVMLILSIIIGMIFGAAPALHASAVNLTESLKEGGPSASSGGGQSRTQRIFVVSEVALSFVLLVGAGLLLRSFLKLQRADLGFNPDRVLTMQIPLPRYQYPNDVERIAAYRQILEKIRRLPVVRSSALVAALPFAGLEMGTELPARPGMANFHASEPLSCSVQMISPEYFHTMGIPLLSGRTFTEEDRQHSQLVAIVNEALARVYWPGQNPVGKEIVDNFPRPKTIIRVVGVVGNTKEDTDSVWELPSPGIYYPYWQRWFPASLNTLVVKTLTRGSTAEAIQEVVHSVDPQAPIAQVLTMGQVLARSRSGDRFFLLLVGVFALLALVLAAAGIASTVSCAVSQRKHEIGIRMALGAEREAILRLVMGEILWLALIGVAVGVAGSLALTRFVASQLHGVAANDPLTFALVSLLFFAVCFLASFIPAIRAATINPAETLRTS
jgi:putative ABC transport system permease protein